VIPAFHATIQPAPPAVTSSWHRGCPVPRSALRLVTVTYRGFDGAAHAGRIVVNVRAAEDAVRVFRSLYAARYPIRRMVPIDAYGNDDDRSLAADNTSAFNCRRVAGASRWSMHAYGLAIDLDPLENPYVSGSHVSPPAGRRFVSRPWLPGVIHRGDAVWRAFHAIGWSWGGDWRAPSDYQHFSSNGR